MSEIEELRQRIADLEEWANGLSDEPFEPRAAREARERWYREQVSKQRGKK